MKRQENNNGAPLPPGEKPLGKHCTYLDCLCDRAPVPHAQNGDTLYKVLMTGGMVAFMTTINGLRNTGLGFIHESLWLYPFVFCIALLVRIFYAGKASTYLRVNYVDPNFKGAPHALVNSFMSTLVTSPVMCAITTLLLVGPENFWGSYFATLPITAPMSIVVSYFIVGPAVKMLFNNYITPARGMKLLRELEEEGETVARLMGMY